MCGMSCSEVLNALGLDHTSQGRVCSQATHAQILMILIYADTSQEDRRMLDDFHTYIFLNYYYINVRTLAYVQGSIEDFQHHLCITVAGLELQLSHIPCVPATNVLKSHRHTVRECEKVCI